MPSSQHALMEATKKRAAKLEAKGKPGDFKELVVGCHGTRMPIIDSRCFRARIGVGEREPRKPPAIWASAAGRKRLLRHIASTLDPAADREPARGKTHHDEVVVGFRPERGYCTCHRQRGLDRADIALVQDSLAPYAR